SAITVIYTLSLHDALPIYVAKQWEQTFFSFTLPKTRQVALRISIVLGGSGGVMTPYKYLVKFGLGGKQGSGEQMFSWIHVEDLYNILLFIKDREDMNGVINCSTPNPVTNETLMKELRTAFNRKFGLPAAKWMLELGAILIRTETELILKSRWVIPEKLLKYGFSFQYDTMDKALNQIIEEN